MDRKGPFEGQKKMAITRKLWIQYILPPLSLHYRCTMITTLCIEDQNGDRVVYHQGTHIPFGSLFAKYMSNKGIQPIDRLFLFHGRRIRHNETPKGLGFDTEHHVIIFVNLLMFLTRASWNIRLSILLPKGKKGKGCLTRIP